MPPKKGFTWTREAEKSFEEMKRYIKKLLTLVAPKARESLIVYLAASRECVSAVLMAKRGKYQRPIYFVNTQEEDDETDFQNQEEKGKNTGWRIYTDGASSDNGSWAGLMIVSPEGMEFTYALKFEFTVTNNEAEYEVVKPGLRIAKEMKIEEITVFVDSQLVANQVNGSYEAKHHHIKQYLQITKELLKSF
ncbi:reverse transcriptase domain-containing protein [Tanacetum coccineum]